MNDTDFWNYKDKANLVIRDVSSLKNLINPNIELKKDIEDNLSLLEDEDEIVSLIRNVIHKLLKGGE